MTMSKRTKGQTLIYKTQDRKLKIEEHDLSWKPGGDSRCSWRISSSVVICDTDIPCRL